MNGSLCCLTQLHSVAPFVRIHASRADIFSNCDYEWINIEVENNTNLLAARQATLGGIALVLKSRSLALSLLRCMQGEYVASIHERCCQGLLNRESQNKKDFPLANRSRASLRRDGAVLSSLCPTPETPHTHTHTHTHCCQAHMTLTGKLIP